MNKTKRASVKVVNLYWADVEYSGGMGDSRERQVGPSLSLIGVKKLQRREVRKMRSEPGRKGPSIGKTYTSLALKVGRGKYYELDGKPSTFIEATLTKNKEVGDPKVIALGGKMFVIGSSSKRNVVKFTGEISKDFCSWEDALVIGETMYLLDGNEPIDIEK